MTSFRSPASRLQKLLTSVSIVLLLSGSIHTAFGTQEADNSSSAGSDLSPIAEDLFQVIPTEPEDLLRAARITQRLDRIDDSKRFLIRFLDQTLTEADLRVVRESIGPHELLALRMDQRLSPEGKEVLRRLNAASAAKQVTTEDAENAAAKIATTGYVGVNAQTSLLAAPDVSASVLLKLPPGTPEGRIAETLLAEHISVFQDPLLAALQADELDAATQVRALQLIGKSSDATIADQLLRFQFSTSSEVAEASRQAIELLTSNQMDVASRESATDYLITRSENLLKHASARFTSLRSTSAMRELEIQDPRKIAIQNASRLLADAQRISPDSDRVKVLSLVASLMSQQTIIEQSLQTEMIIHALHTAMELGSDNPTTTLFKSLSARTLTATEIQSATPVLRQALNSADPRVRFAAAVLAQNERRFIVSDSQLDRTFNAIRSGSEKPEAVVVTGEDRVLDDLKFTIEQAGFSVRAAQSAPDGFLLAAEQMNCELYLLSAEAPTWPLAVSLANLRADVRTRHVPIVVFGPERFRPRVEELAKIYSGVWFTSQPLATTVTFETRPADREFAKIRTSRSEIQLNLEQLELPEILLPVADRQAMKAMIQ
ncbi:MAG: hypothetical protein ACK58L_21115 [Planctomycetota bacterium]